MDTALDQQGSTVRDGPMSRFVNCDAVVVSLSPTRHVIVRRDDAQRVVPVERICKAIRNLKPGDQVIYNGRRETVYGLSVF